MGKRRRGGPEDEDWSVRLAGKLMRSARRPARNAAAAEGGASSDGGAPAGGVTPAAKKNRPTSASVGGGSRGGPPALGAQGGPCEEMPDDSAPAESGVSSLLRLRSLLTPVGFGESAATEAEGLAGRAADGASKKRSERAEGAGALLVPAGSNGALGAPADFVAQSPGPDWTSRYCVVDASAAATLISDLRRPLHPTLKLALERAGFGSLFPIQAAVIPLLACCAESATDLDSRYNCDVCVAAPTGQGKTLAYAVPIVESLLERVQPAVRALVVLPTRDLAMQVWQVFESLRLSLGIVGGASPARALCLLGQSSFAMEQRQIQTQSPDVIICTPGRLLDHLVGEGALDLSSLRWLVVDEADRLLGGQSTRWLDLLAKVPSEAAEAVGFAEKPRLQKVMLSATMTWDPRKLSMLRLKRPLYFLSSQTGRYATPSDLLQHYLHCRERAKPLAVLHLVSQMLSGEQGGALVFCSSVDTAHRLARLLQIICCVVDVNGQQQHLEDAAGDEQASFSSVVSAELRQPGAIAEFSSILTQKERTSLLSNFRKGAVRCLICSDVVARGIDIQNVRVVINYTMPPHLQAYIHRAGRTARAGAAGHVFTMVRGKDMRHFKKMLRQSADCWQRVQRYFVPESADCTKCRWYASSLELLGQCFDLEEAGAVKASRTLRKGDLAPDSQRGLA